MPCDTLGDRLTGYLDGELDERGVGEVERHLRQCVVCTAQLERERRLRRAVQAHLEPLTAPDTLRASVRAAIRAEVEPTAPLVAPAAAPALAHRRAWLPTWAGAAAALVLGLAGGWQLATVRAGAGERSELAAEVMASHVRSLQGAHLTDVGSSEHHTVKPWFTGRLDFSPPVPELAGDGFELVGGRLDYLKDRQVAALVYKRRQHVINLFVWPGSDADASPSTAAVRGYHVVHGAAGGMAYWAISDLNEAELAQFAQLTADDLRRGAGRP